ncbi:MAG: hypothetical protein ACE5DM_04760 [Candidatus Nanoarchaeia archaeon]
MDKCTARGHNLMMRYLDGGRTASVPHKAFFRDNKIESNIRLRKEDFDSLPKDRKYLTHFNLQCANHLVGKVYALPLIVKHGHFREDKELPPVLSFKNCPVAECTEVRQNVPYDDLTEDDFKNSFPTIKNVDQLKKAILKRYIESMPELSEEKILSMGVAITKLKIICRWEEWIKQA